MLLTVVVKKLNRRSEPPGSLSQKNIVGTVFQGFQFEGTEITHVPNSALGKWYRDKDGYCYWGGGLVAQPAKIISNMTAPALSPGAPVPTVIPPFSPVNLAGMPINLPYGFKLGVDISHHNDEKGKIDWDAFKRADVSFVYIKTSEGVGTPDKKAKEHADNARQNNFRIGYYHFCRPDTRNGGTIINDATAEANDALDIIAKLQKPALPLVLDLEDQNNWDTSLQPPEYLLWIHTFVNKIKDVLGTDPIFYSRAEYFNRKLPADHDLGKYKLWLSYYPKNPDCRKVPCPRGWSDWSIWQYTESGVIGTNKVMDINILKDPSLFNDIG